MNVVYRFRMYPNKSQEEQFAKTFGCVRFVYNRMLAEKMETIHTITASHRKDWRKSRGGSAVVKREVQDIGNKDIKWPECCSAN